MARESAADTDPFPECEIHGSGLFFGSVGLLAAIAAIACASVGQVFFATIAAGCAGWSGFRLWIKPARVRVTTEGIVDETFWYSPGLIRWSEIIDVRERRWGLIEIDLLNETTFWERLGPLSQLALIKYQLYGFGPALIVSWALEGRRSDIVDALQDGLDTFALTSFADPGALGPPSPIRHDVEL